MKNKLMRLPNKSQSRWLSTKLITPLMVSGLCLLAVGFIFSGSASAETDVPIGGSGPEVNSGTTSGGADFTPLTGVGQGNFDGEYMWYKIYVKNGQATDIHVNETCADQVGQPTVVYTVESLSDSEQDVLGNSPNQYGPIQQTSTPNNCTQQFSFSIGANAGNTSNIQGHTQYQVYAFIAQMKPGPGSLEQYFSVTSTNSANTYIGLSRPDAIQKQTLRFSTIYRTSGTWSASVMFAPRCNIVGAQPANIQVYDADNGVYQGPPAAGPYMTASLEQSPGSPAGISWSTATTWDAATVQGGPFGTSNTTGTLPYGGYDGAHIYKLHLLNSAHPNTIQVKLPFDQFDATPVAQAGCPSQPVCNDPTAINFGGPLPCKYPNTNGQCNIVTQPVRTPPGQAVNFAVRITNLGTTTLSSPAIKLFIVGPAGVTGSFNIPTVPAATAQDMTVAIINVPPNPGSFPNYRTYQLGYDPNTTFGGTCSPDLLVGSTTYGDLTAASCLEIKGDVWVNDSSNAPTQGRLQVTVVGSGQQAWTAPFGTAGGSHGAGGKWFYIDPYQYVPGGPVGPGIDLKFNYHDRYQIDLQVQDSAGNWYIPTDPAGTAASKPFQYPCITGSIGTSCTNVGGVLSYQSRFQGDTDAEMQSVSAAGTFSTGQMGAHYGYGRDPFNPAGWGGGQNLPHLGTTFLLYYWDQIDHTGPYPALSSDGSPQVATSIAPNVCLQFSCVPSTFPFEVTTNPTHTFDMGYTNYSIDNIPGYFGVMTSDGTVRISNGGPPGTGPLNSTPGIFANPASAYNGSFVWSNIRVSSTGIPYNGNINLAATYGGSPIDSPTAHCQITVYQVTKPYIKAFGSSISTGGAFADSSTPTSATGCGAPRMGGARAFARFNPADPNVPDTPNNYVAGAGKFGASIEYSIESLGLIQAQNSAGMGFYSGDTHDAAGDLINTLDVGDQTPPPGGWGGNLGGTHCVPNYYCAHLSIGCKAGGTPAESPWGGRSVATMFSDASINKDAGGNVIRAEAFYANPGAGHAINLNGGSNLPRNTRVTLFVNGDVYINNNNGNITYDPGIGFNSNAINPDGTNSTNPPYFTLIATGSIYVDPGVTQLEGLYVAQSGDGFSTCGILNGNTAGNRPATGPAGSPQIFPDCNQKLVVNGVVVAYQLKLLRIGTEVNTLNNAAGDNGSSIYSASVPAKNNHAVEEFNYTPNMVENYPYYLTTSTGGLGTTEKIFSLPPVY